jgi:two-component system, sensor histidine kinase and response regulator
LVLLTSSGARGDEPRFAKAGISSYLLKPVTQRDLLACLRLVLTAPAEACHSHTQPIVTCHELEAALAKSRHRILVADDNVVNQKVAGRLLEKLGHDVHIAADGREALTAWKTGSYDLILIDCQMPELDGYQATRQIRRLEAGPRRVPIVALTAHAMKGADQECLEAGMDDYLISRLTDKNSRPVWRYLSEDGRHGKADPTSVLMALA